jgi:hypothetical protein
MRISLKNQFGTGIKLYGFGSSRNVLIDNIVLDFSDVPCVGVSKPTSAWELNTELAESRNMKRAFALKFSDIPIGRLNFHLARHSL